MAINPDVFMSAEAFRERMDALVQRVHGIAPAPGFKEVLFPGKPEHRLAEMRTAEGIPYADAEKKMFQDKAKQFAVTEMKLSVSPLNVV
jgi:LDH2 family malate/lactate/ureidoglycolate dehydrogenase